MGPLAVAVFFLFALVALANHSWGLLAVGAALPYALMLSGRVERLLALSICASLSQLTIPGLGALSNLQLYQILALAFGAIMILRAIITKERSPHDPARWFLWALVLVLGVTVYVRGFGLRILGDSKIGGAAYIQVLSMMLFYWGASRAQLAERQWRVSLIGMFCLAILPLAANLLLILSHGAIYQQYSFLSISMGTLEGYRTYGAGQATRWTGFASLSGIYLIPFLFLPFRGKYRFLYGFFIGASIVFSTLSGYRSVFVMPFLFTGLAMLLMSKNRAMTAFLMALAGVLMLALLFVFVRSMPFPAQRVLSIVPFLPVDSAVRASASGTLDWRMLLWSRWFNEAPQYLLLGKGFAYSESQYMSALRYVISDYDLIEPSVILGDYHLGILSAIAVVGIPGVIALLGFWVLAARKHLQCQRMSWASAPIQRIHCFFLLQTVVLIVYQMSAGSFVYALNVSFFNFGLLNALVNSGAPGCPAPVRAEPQRLNRRPLRAALQGKSAGGPA